MTTSQIIVCAISWTAAVTAVWALGRARRARLDMLHSGERCGALKPVFFENGQRTECVLRPHMGSHKDEHGTRWWLTPVAAKDGAVCEAYRLPTAAEDSGLCAHCGMYDYKHEEQSGA